MREYKIIEIFTSHQGWKKVNIKMSANEIAEGFKTGAFGVLCVKLPNTTGVDVYENTYQDIFKDDLNEIYNNKSTKEIKKEIKEAIGKFEYSEDYKITFDIDEYILYLNIYSLEYEDYIDSIEVAESYNEKKLLNKINQLKKSLVKEGYEI